MESISEKAVEEADAMQARHQCIRVRQTLIGRQFDNAVLESEQILGRERSVSSVSSNDGSNKRVKRQVANLTKLIWDEFYLCDPLSEKHADLECPCGDCHTDDLDMLLGGKETEINTSAKCKAIP